MTDPQSTPIDEHMIFESMISFGGSFVEALGHAFFAGDDVSRRRLREAFPEYWDKYAEVVQRQMRTAAATDSGGAQ